MPDLPLDDGMPQLPTHWVQQINADLSVGFVSALTNSPALYKRGSFGDAPITDPIQTALTEVLSVHVGYMTVLAARGSV